MTMNVNLDTQCENIVRQKIAYGLYASASEVIREALRMLEIQDNIRLAKLKQLQTDISEGLESGVSTPWNLEEMQQECRARCQKTND